MPVQLTSPRVLTATRGVLGEVLAEVVPGWADIEAAAIKCAEQERQLGTATRVQTASLLDDQAHDLVAGGEFPDDFAGSIGDRLRRTEDLERSVDLVREVRNRVTSLRDQAVYNAAGLICRSLDRRLQEVLAAARRRKLKGAQNADDAIARGVADAWAEYCALRARYFDLRLVQAKVYADTGGGVPAARVTTFGYFANYAADFPAWQDWRADGREIGTQGGSGGPIEWRSSAAAPWPDAPPERFRWLVDHPEVEVWIPTEGQIEEAVAAAQEAAREPTPAQRQAEVEQRNREQQQREHAETLEDRANRKAAREQAERDAVGV